MSYRCPKIAIMEVVLAATKALVDLPNFVSVEFETSEDVTAFKIEVHKDDRYNFMGRGGSNMRALRTLCGAISEKHNLRTVLVLCE